MFARKAILAVLLFISLRSAVAQTALTTALMLVKKIGPGYNVSQTTQDSLNAWLINESLDGYLMTTYKNEIIRYPARNFQTGTLHVVLTSVADGKLGSETITIDSTSSASNPDNGVRVSSNSIIFTTQSLSIYQAWLLAVENPANGFVGSKLVPYDLLTFTGTPGTLTLGPNQTFGGGGTGSSSYSTADLSQPLSFFMKISWDKKTPDCDMVESMAQKEC